MKKAIFTFFTVIKALISFGKMYSQLICLHFFSKEKLLISTINCFEREEKDDQIIA